MPRNQHSRRSPAPPFRFSPVLAGLVLASTCLTFLHAQAPEERTPPRPHASAATAEARAAAERGSDWREILPGLTMGSQLRLRAEGRNNFRFDESRAGNDEGFVLSRFRWDLTWEPAERVTGVVELQDARIYGERAIDENRTPNIFADELDLHQAVLDLRDE